MPRRTTKRRVTKKATPKDPMAAAIDKAVKELQQGDQLKAAVAAKIDERLKANFEDDWYLMEIIDGKVYDMIQKMVSGKEMKPRIQELIRQKLEQQLPTMVENIIREVRIHVNY